MKRLVFAAFLPVLMHLNAGCAGGPAATDDIERAETDRASSAFEAFYTLMLSEERYGVYVAGQRIGHMLRERAARDGQLITISRIIEGSDDGPDGSQPGSILTEIFSATAPFDAILLQRKDGDGGPGTRSIRLTDTGYVAEFTVNGTVIVEPLFDFQYQLADALAPQVWLRSETAMSQCLTYPGYSLQRFSRNFNTECISQLTAYSIDGADVEAVETRRRSGTSVIRERSNGRELYNQSGRLGVEIRLEPRAIAASLPPLE